MQKTPNNNLCKYFILIANIRIYKAYFQANHFFQQLYEYTYICMHMCVVSYVCTYFDLYVSGEGFCKKSSFFLLNVFWYFVTYSYTYTNVWKGFFLQIWKEGTLKFIWKNIPNNSGFLFLHFSTTFCGTGYRKSLLILKSYREWQHTHTHKQKNNYYKVGRINICTHTQTHDQLHT